MDRLSDTVISAATTEVPGHRSIDIVVRRLGLLAQQGGRGHDLPRLAKPALGDAELDPGAELIAPLAELYGVDASEVERVLRGAGSLR